MQYRIFVTPKGEMIVQRFIFGKLYREPYSDSILYRDRPTSVTYIYDQYRQEEED